MIYNRLHAIIIVLVLLGVTGGIWIYADRSSVNPIESDSRPSTKTVESLPSAQSVTRATSADDEETNRRKSTEVEGVVVGDYRNPDQLRGIFLQPTDKAFDRKGVFVPCGEDKQIAVGDLVRIGGVIDADEGMTVVQPAGERESVALEKIGHVDTLVPFDLPELSEGVEWENILGALVRFSDDMIVADTYDLARYGQVILSTDQSVHIPTNYIDPNDRDRSGTSFEGVQYVSEVLVANEAFLQQSIILDDGFRVQNPPDLFLHPKANKDVASLRVGSKFEGLTGIVTKFKGSYMILPAANQRIEYAKRPARPDLGSANLAVGSLNVLNFYTTLDTGKNQARGADSQSELDRQRSKLIAAFVAMDADVVALMELENNLESEQDLVDSLNRRVGETVYAGIGLPDRFADAPGGTNPIRVGMIYRRDRVVPAGSVESVVDKAFANARTPLAQNFQLVDGEAQLTVIVNHFKSKGSRNATGMDADQNDGQGCYNASRTRQATAIVRYVESLYRMGTKNVLIVGDLNSYAEEDPIDRLRDAGMIDLLQDHSDGQQPFSYVYRGRRGCLDHAFASPLLAPLVTAAKVWHINSVEPRCLDYNVEYNPESLFRPDPFRSSDHDPVLVGISF